MDYSSDFVFPGWSDVWQGSYRLGTQHMYSTISEQRAAQIYLGTVFESWLGIERLSIWS